MEPLSLPLSASTGVASLITVLQVSRGSTSSSVHPRLPGPLFVQGPQSSQRRPWWWRPQNLLLPWKHRSRERWGDGGRTFFFSLFLFSEVSLRFTPGGSALLWQPSSHLPLFHFPQKLPAQCNMTRYLARCFVIAHSFAAFFLLLFHGIIRCHQS